MSLSCADDEPSEQGTTSSTSGSTSVGTGQAETADTQAGTGTSTGSSGAQADDHGSTAAASDSSGDESSGGATIDPLAVLGEETFPEGIAADPDGNVLYVGGAGNGSLQKVVVAGRQAGMATWVREPGEDGLLNVLGLAVDPGRSRLFACSSSFDMPPGPTMLAVYDTETEELLAQLSPPDDGSSYFFNDVTVDSQGRAYVTDSFLPIVWRADADLGAIVPFAEDERFTVDPKSFNLNGIAITPDDNYVIAIIPTFSGVGARLFRISTETAEVTQLSTPERWGGSDGLLFLPDGRMVGIGAAEHIQLFSFSDDYATVEIDSGGLARRALDTPTTAARVGDTLWVTNTQLDHFLPFFRDQGPPELPFWMTPLAVSDL